MIAADCAVYNFEMVSRLGRETGFDESGADGWIRRAAFIRGATVAEKFVQDAIEKAAGSRFTAIEIAALMPLDLFTALNVVNTFNARPALASDLIAQADIDAVTVAAAVIAENLRDFISLFGRD